MYTNFAAQQPHDRLAWGHKAYEQFRDILYFNGWLGNGESAVIEHVTELTEAPNGTTGAMLHLVADIHGGGVTGDNQLRGRERELEAAWQEIMVDQLRNGVVTKGEMAEKRSVIKTRVEAKDKLARWLAESVEDQAILTASGISYAFNLDGSPRVTPGGQDPWTGLDYAADVTPPSANRHVRWDGTANAYVAGDTTAIAAGDKAEYASLPDLFALASRRGLKPLRSDGDEYYVYLTSPEQIATWYKDADFRSVIVNAGDRGSRNPIFKGNSVLTLHNILIKPYRKTFTTLGAASGQKWGAAGDINGTRSLLLGAQALGFADIAIPKWKEESDDYDNIHGVAIRKMMGFLKPKFPDPITGTVEDFGVIAVDFAL